MDSPSKPSILERIGHSLGWIGVCGTAVSLTAHWSWLADVASQLSVQFLILSLLVVPLWTFRRKRRALTLAIAAIAVNLWFVAPYFLPRDVPNTSGRTFRLTIFNVLRTNEEIDATLSEATASDPDFVFLMEVSGKWTQALTQLKDTYPHQKLITREDYTGVALLSKHKWQQLTVMNGLDANLPIDVSFAIDESHFRMLLTHPLPPIGADLAAARDDQLTELAKTVSSEVPTLLAGDFNQTPWSSRFRDLLSGYDLTDGSKGFGISPTLTPLPTWFGGVKVDHVLINSGVAIRDFEVGDTLYSDHRPVSVDFEPYPSISQ